MSLYDGICAPQMHSKPCAPRKAPGVTPRHSARAIRYCILDRIGTVGSCVGVRRRKAPLAAPRRSVNLSIHLFASVRNERIGGGERVERRAPRSFPRPLPAISSSWRMPSACTEWIGGGGPCAGAATQTPKNSLSLFAGVRSSRIRVTRAFPIRLAFPFFFLTIYTPHSPCMRASSQSLGPSSSPSPSLSPSPDRRSRSREPRLNPSPKTLTLRW
mmetsp:Transcript_35801/g.112360  ORF Transcript_35801/g.112360 Transcript_35801/m.112360 type:complete len:215 (-) Transcript_35801:121-765(-)